MPAAVFALPALFGRLWQPAAWKFPPCALGLSCCSMPRCISASRWHGHQGTRRPLSGLSGTPRRARHFVLVLRPVVRIEIWFPESAANRQGGSTTLFGAWMAMLHTSRSNRLMLHRHGIAPLALLPGTVDAAMDGVPLSRPFPCPDVQTTASERLAGRQSPLRSRPTRR